jgi:type IV pilus assembly protein PilY1
MGSIALASLACFPPQAPADDTEIFAAPSLSGASAFRRAECNQAGRTDGVFAPLALPLGTSPRGTYLNQVYAGLFRYDPGALPHWSGGLMRYQLTDSGDAGIALVQAGEKPGRVGAARPLAHADVLHSRPAAINYNRDSTATTVDDDDVLIVYGSNDGLIRAVKGGQKATPPAGTVITSANARSYSGYEKWTFTPEEFLPRVERLRGNDAAGPAPAPRKAGAPAAAKLNPEAKAYFADGGIAVHVKDGNHDGKLSGAADTVQIFISMRRGGRLLYAMDISDPDTPKFMWKKGCPEPGSTEGTAPACDAGYGELGQTWSQPTPARIRYKAAATETAAEKNVLIFGAGYDPAVDDQDPIPPSGANSRNTVGRGIFVVDMADGRVLWRAGPNPGHGNAAPNLLVSAMTYSIPSDIAAIDRDADGYIDRVYVGDTGGNVWRLDMADSHPDNWTVNKLASLGYAQSASANDRRKFLYPPSIVAGSDAGGPYDAVLIGSGDREHPFNGYGDRYHPPGKTVANRFYMLKDRSVGGWGLDRDNRAIAVATISDRGWLSPAASNPDLADVTANYAQGNDTTAVDPRKGWFISLADNGRARPGLRGEKAVGAAVTAAGVVHFATHRPTPHLAGHCGSNLGEARIYRVNFANGSAMAGHSGSGSRQTSDRYRLHAGGGLLPSPVFILTRPAAAIPGTRTAPVQVVCFGTDCSEVPGPALQARIRAYSYTEGE